jgi:hypothetical protein
MANVFFDTPMNLTGTAEEQLRTLYGYLYTMSEKLNEAMNTITVDNMDQELQTKIREIPGKEDRTQEMTALKSMIIKTANIVRSEMDEIRTVLEGHYEAISDQFGTYEQNLTNTITATAEGILQDYHVVENITTNTTNLETLKKNISQYIFTGLIDPVNDIYGVAVGNNVTNDDDSLNTDQMCATFTMKEMAFYINGVKMAWFGNDSFHINEGVIEKSLQIGNHKWMAREDGGMVLVKV